MKKSLLLLLALFTLLSCLLLSSCGGGDDPDEDEGPYNLITVYKYSGAAPVTYKAKNNTFSLGSHDMTRTGYKFMGLFDQPNGGMQIVDRYGVCNISIVGDMTLYGQWEAQSYNLILDPADGTLESPEDTIPVTYGEGMGNLPVATKEGFDFLGWENLNEQLCTDENGTPIEEASVFGGTYYPIVDNKCVLIAKFEIRKLDVEFNYNDGTYKSESITVKYGTELDPDTFPEKDDGKKCIIGWSVSAYENIPFEGAVEEDMTLYAIWLEYEYIKFYEFPDSEDTEPVEVQIFNDGKTAEIKEPERPGYDFVGWYTTKHLAGLPVEAIVYGGTSKVYYAKWEPIIYNLEFDSSGGTEVADMTYTILDTLELPTPEREYSTFIGWCINEDLSDRYPMTELPIGTYDLTKLYAKYKGDDRKVLFDAGSGTLSTTQKIIEYGAVTTLPVPVLDGYVFRGWFSSSDDEGVQLTDEKGLLLERWTNDNDYTVYAKYDKKYYISLEITIPAAGEVEVKPYYIVGEDVELVAVTNTGYVFSGWYDINGVISRNKTLNFKMTASDMNIRAVFEAKVSNITLDVDGGSCKSDTAALSYGESFKLLIPYKKGFEFDGWFYGEERITDASGNSVAAWTYEKDITLKAVYAEDTSGKIYIFDTKTLLSMAEKPDGNYVLIDDINMNGVKWTPFAFSGTLEGNGCSISNLSISAASGHIGMFTTMSGTVRSLTLTNISVESTSFDMVLVGGLCAESTGTISDVTVSGTITSDFANTGGIAGKVSKGTVTGCINQATVTSATLKDGNYVGGITGQFTGGSITNCKNEGAVSGRNFVGGIIGHSSCPNYSSLENSGSISGKVSVGGIFGAIGYTGTYSFTNLTNSGSVTGTNNVGGIGGQIETYWDTGYSTRTYTSYINKVYNTGSISGAEYVGGCFGHIYGNVTNKSGYNSWLLINMTALENDANVTGTAYVGGLIGYAHADNGSSNITASKSTGVITADYRVGGLAGKLDNIGIYNSSNSGTTLNINSYQMDGSSYLAYSGGYVGMGYYVENCHNAVEISYKSRGNYIGGIAGVLYNGIKNCTNTANITAKTSSYVGGLVGELSLAHAYNITDLRNSGAVQGVDNVGGIAGKIYSAWDTGYSNNTYTAYINKATNTGSVTGSNNVAGCFGHIYANISNKSGYNSWMLINMTALENNANVTGTACVGGLVGYAYADNGSSNISASKSTGIITADYLVGGIAGQLDNVGIYNSSNEGTTLKINKYQTDGSNYYAFAGGYVGKGYYVENCHNAVEISYTQRGNYIGGIAGVLYNGIKNCSNTADVTALTSSYVGGLVGELNLAHAYNITELKNSGTVKGVELVGGIAGNVHSSWNTGYSSNGYTSYMSKVSNEGSIVGTKYVAGCFGKIYADITNKSGYNSWMLINMSQISNSGDIVGESITAGLVGSVSTDNSSSQIVDYTMTGTVTAPDTDTGLLIAQMSNFSIIE